MCTVPCPTQSRPYQCHFPCPKTLSSNDSADGGSSPGRSLGIRFPIGHCPRAGPPAAVAGDGVRDSWAGPPAAVAGDRAGALVFVFVLCCHANACSLSSSSSMPLVFLQQQEVIPVGTRERIQYQTPSCAGFYHWRASLHPSSLCRLYPTLLTTVRPDGSDLPATAGVFKIEPWLLLTSPRHDGGLSSGSRVC